MRSIPINRRFSAERSTKQVRAGVARVASVLAERAAVEARAKAHLSRPGPSGRRAQRYPLAMKLTTRSICLLAAAVALLAACAAPQEPTGSFYRCDRNGEREQRVACEP